MMHETILKLIEQYFKSIQIVENLDTPPKLGLVFRENMPHLFYQYSEALDILLNSLNYHYYILKEVSYFRIGFNQNNITTYVDFQITDYKQFLEEFCTYNFQIFLYRSECNHYPEYLIE